jgi:hypothetical protein
MTDPRRETRCLTCGTSDPESLDHFPSHRAAVIPAAVWLAKPAKALHN